MSDAHRVSEHVYSLASRLESTTAHSAASWNRQQACKRLTPISELRMVTVIPHVVWLLCWGSPMLGRPPTHAVMQPRAIPNRQRGKRSRITVA